MVRDGPAQEALLGAEGHQAESGLSKCPRVPLSHEELSYSHSLHLSSLGDPGLHGIGELSPQLGEDPLSLCSVPQGQDSGNGCNHWREPRSGSNSIRFAPSDLFWAHIVPDSADTEQKHKQVRVPGGQVQCTPGSGNTDQESTSSECLLCVRRCSSGFSGIVTIYQWLLQLAHLTD